MKLHEHACLCVRFEVFSCIFDDLWRRTLCPNPAVYWRHVRKLRCHVDSLVHDVSVSGQLQKTITSLSDQLWSWLYNTDYINADGHATSTLRYFAVWPLNKTISSVRSKHTCNKTPCTLTTLWNTLPSLRDPSRLNTSYIPIRNETETKHWNCLKRFTPISASL